MKTNRRKFLSTAVMGGVAATTLPLSACRSETTTAGPLIDIKARFDRIDEILKQPVLKK